MRSSPLALLTLPVTALAVAGCSGSSTASSSPASSGAKAATGRTATVTASEFAFAPKTLAAKAGKLRVTLDNQGKIVHELILLKTSAAPGSLKVGADGRVSEKASVGEVSETKGGVSRSTTFDLKPGRYVYVCNLPGHYKDGMYGELTVS